MGFSKTHPHPSLKPISTRSRRGGGGGREEGVSLSAPTTPTSKDSRIPERLPCPPAPRKRRPSATVVFYPPREFFNPPDLESVFKYHLERANC
ncbi:hypothetical protein MLD38_022687 [Melastoma candidum]|uniref:Uncharacterized protein n=1 Tax=Melastoma candidum TaxID=119954 RepID=A0ACB9QN51_9MYRT|nr:hypothetical protein MLD38_022687 [Melastoma candidum]